MYMVCSLDLHFMSGQTGAQNGMENASKCSTSHTTIEATGHHLTPRTTWLSVAFFFGEINILLTVNCFFFK